MRPIIRAVHRDINLDLTSPQIQLLQFLEDDGPLKMSEIASRLKITLGGATPLANRMEKAQLIERQRSEADRRVVRLAISKTGASLLHDLATVRNQALQDYFSKLNPEEIEELERLCRKMLA